MATYRQFEDLPVWQRAIDLACQVYDVTESDSFRGRYSLRDQMERSSLSISSNIAEGFERGTKSEFLNFLYIARGSAGELRSQLHFSARRNLIDRGAHGQLRGLCLNVSRQLGGFTAYLRDSDLKGQRHFTAQEKARKDAGHEREAFDRMIDKMVEAAAEKRRRQQEQDER